MADTTRYSTIEERLLVWLNAIAKENNLPDIMLDYAATEDSITFQTIGTQQILKEYINGSKLKRMSFRLARVFRGADTSSVPSLDALAGIRSLASEIHYYIGEKVAEGTTLISESCSTPSLLWRSEEGDSAYGITITIDYKEEEVWQKKQLLSFSSATPTEQSISRLAILVLPSSAKA